ncbi:hypothetical protein OHA21_38275 [Actinoplanes sp. NBC_00393]|uniref:hypothetical protein n=1 Tax=Actinoplanes sp. NBC_00393 TaxID=2975953 RepID=UPI002E1A43A6
MSDATVWATTLTGLYTAGLQAGRDAADQWARTSLGRRVLTRRGPNRSSGIGGQLVPYLGGTGGWVTGETYQAAAGNGQPSWDDLTDTQRDEVLGAHADGFDDGVHERSHVHLQAATSVLPWRMLPHLHPDRLRVGAVGVFAGGWSWQRGPFGRRRIPVGFVGTLREMGLDGRAVFACTRQVADAIVADQRRLRVFWRDELVNLGVRPQACVWAVERLLPTIGFDGDQLVVDETSVIGGPDSTTRITPDDDGEYVVMGGAWDWRPVDPHDCDRIVGEVPAPGEQQRFAPLPHAPGMQVPHDRFRLRMLSQWPVSGDMAYVAALLLDGQRIGTVGDDATGSGRELLMSDAAGAAAWTSYVAASRHDGRRVDQQRLLDALADQMFLTTAVAVEAAMGSTLLRLLDDAGTTLALRPIPTPASQRDIEQVLTEPTAGGQWRIWTGHAWHILPDRSSADRW